MKYVSKRVEIEAVKIIGVVKADTENEMCVDTDDGKSILFQVSR